MTQSKKLKKRTTKDKSTFLHYGNMICKRPEYRYEAVFKRDWIGTILSFNDPALSYDIVGFRKVKDD